MRRPVPLPRCLCCREPLQRDQLRRWSLQSNDGAVVRCSTCNALLKLHVRVERVAGLGITSETLAVSLLQESDQ